MPPPFHQRAGAAAPAPLPTLDGGEGGPLLFLHGFALGPATYGPLFRELCAYRRVVVPRWMEPDGGDWTFTGTLDAVAATLDAAGVGRVTVVGHSFGGALGIGFTARHRARVDGLVVADTLGLLSGPAELTRKVARAQLGRLFSVRATLDFFRSVGSRPTDVARAAWWGLHNRLDDDVTTVAALPIPRHVLWAEDDSMLPRRDGEGFARRLDAEFTAVASNRRTGWLDHTWPYTHPDVFVDALRGLALLDGARRSS